MGGRVWAAKKISASAIGAKSECKTAISLGGTPCLNFERDYVREKMKKQALELEKLEEQPDSPAKSSLMGKLRMKMSVSELKLKQLEEDLAEAKLHQSEKDSGRMECGIAYPGTEIRFGDELLRLREETRHCIAVLACDEILLM